MSEPLPVSLFALFTTFGASGCYRGGTGQGVTAERADCAVSALRWNAGVLEYWSGDRSAGNGEGNERDYDLQLGMGALADPTRTLLLADPAEPPERIGKIRSVMFRAALWPPAIGASVRGAAVILESACIVPTAATESCRNGRFFRVLEERGASWIGDIEFCCVLGCLG